MYRSLTLLLVLLAGAFAAPVLGCDFDDDDGPDVALVLSGGGALASTQIGALILIEELGIPIHCVAGTSMGAVVGALYAGGYSPQEIREIFQDVRWGELFNPPRKRRDRGYLEKEREDEYLSDYVAGFGENGVLLPGGVASMAGLKAFYRELLFHVPVNGDFDDLTVPYRAVATDVSTGKARAFGEGDLVEAMLASMALPAVFGPRLIDGRVYLDGGLAENLPVKTAVAMGADIIIAIDNTLEPPELGPNTSFADIAQQLGRLLVWQNYQDQVALLDEDDVLIRPDVTGFSISEFSRVEDGVARGQAATREQIPRLRRIAGMARPAPTPPRERTTPEIDRSLRVENSSVIDDERVLARLDLEVQDFDRPERVQRKLRDLASFGGFGEVDLSQDGLSPVLTVKERPLGRTLVSMGLRAQSNLDGDSNYGLLARVSQRPFSRKGGELSLSTELGTNLGVTAELYQPFGNDGRFFAQPTLGFRAQEILFDIEDFRVGEFWQQSGTFQVRVGRELGDWGILALDALATTGRVRPQVTVAPDVFTTERYTLAGGGAKFGVDTLDRGNWPVAGARLDLSAQFLREVDESAQNNKYRFSYLQAASFGSFGFALRLQGESIESENDDPVEILALGGFRRLSAFSPNSLPTNRYGLASVEVFRRLTGTDAVFSFPLYAGMTLEYANVAFDFFDQGVEENYGAVGAYLGADTLIGPIALGFGHSDEGRYSFFLNIGTAF